MSSVANRRGQGHSNQLSLLLHAAKVTLQQSLPGLHQALHQIPFFRRWKGGLGPAFFLELCEPVPQAPCTVLLLAATDHLSRTHIRKV